MRRASTVLPLLLLALGSAPALSSQAAPGGWIKEFGTMWTFDAPPLAYWKGQYGFEPRPG